MFHDAQANERLCATDSDHSTTLSFQYPIHPLDPCTGDSLQTTFRSALTVRRNALIALRWTENYKGV